MWVNYVGNVRESGFVRGSKLPAPGLNGKWPRVSFIEFHGRHAYYLTVFYIDKERPGIGIIDIPFGVVAHVDSVFYTSGKHLAECLHKPPCQLIRAFQR